jgi:hypothetical protein
MTGVEALMRLGRRLLPLITLLALGPVGAAHAGMPVVYQNAGTELFRIDVPDNWTLRVGEELDKAAMPAGLDPAPRIISMMPEGGAGRMWLGFWSPTGVSGLDGGIAYVKSLDQRMLQDAKVTGSRDIGLPAGPARIVSGTAKRLGDPVVFDIAVIALPSGRVIVGAFIGEAELRE